MHAEKCAYVFSNGAALTAEWRDGVTVGDIYIGGWADHTMHGYGTRTTLKYTCVALGARSSAQRGRSPTPTVALWRALLWMTRYTTEWAPWCTLMVTLHGSGVFAHADGSTQQGEFRKGRLHPDKGTVVYPDGARKTAEWRDGHVVGDVHYTFLHTLAPG